MKRILLEALLFLLLATGAGLVANSFNPNGLEWGRDYFHASQASSNEPTESGEAALSSGSHLPHNFGRATLEQVKEISETILEFPGEEIGVYILDARQPSVFEDGHIPGSDLCFYYKKERYLPGLAAKLKNATQVIIYCNGGDCEDSILLCRSLVDAGYWEHPYETLSIFEGGWEEWQANSLPVSKGR